MKTVLWMQWNISHRPQMHRESQNRNHFKVSTTPVPNLDQNRKWLFINVLIPCSGTGYSQKIEHLEQPLHTNISQINTLMFVTRLKLSRRKQSTAPSKQLLGAIYYAKERKSHELLIIDQLAKDPLCSLNRDHRPIGCLSIDQWQV